MYTVSVPATNIAFIYVIYIVFMSGPKFFLHYSQDSEIKVRGTVLEGDKSTELVLILWQMFIVLVQAQVMEWGLLLQLSLY